MSGKYDCVMLWFGRFTQEKKKKTKKQKNHHHHHQQQQQPNQNKEKQNKQVNGLLNFPVGVTLVMQRMKIR